MRRLILSSLFCAAAALAAEAQTIAGADIAALRASSQRGLPAATTLLGALVTRDNAALLGFSSPEVAGRATPETPLVDFAVREAGLRSYSGEDPLGLLFQTGQVLYPMRTDRGGYITITLARRAEGWDAVVFGAPAIAQALVATRATVARDLGVSPDQLFQVRVRGLNLIFVGAVQGGALRLAPVFAAPEHGLQAGRAYDARQVFTGLVAAARQADGSPG